MMYGPRLADPVCQPQGTYPGVCRISESSLSGYGFFVPYQSVRLIRGSLSTHERAIVHLFVEDLYSLFSRPIPFFIDTGANVTILPRQLVPKNAFPKSKADPPVDQYIEGISGGQVTGRYFHTLLTIPPPSSQFKPIHFDIDQIFVTNTECQLRYALLGLDALESVVMVSDNTHVTFWQYPRTEVTKALQSLQNAFEDPQVRTLAWDTLRDALRQLELEARHDGLGKLSRVAAVLHDTLRYTPPEDFHKEQLQAFAEAARQVTDVNPSEADVKATLRALWSAGLDWLPTRSETVTDEPAKGDSEMRKTRRTKQSED